MRTLSTWKIADAPVTALTALVIGLLFSWWAGAAVFLLWLAAVMQRESKRKSSFSRSELGPSDDDCDCLHAKP